nr:hypothetical protein [Nostoc sp. EkiNYC01]
MSICFNGFKVELSANTFTAYVQDMPDNRGLRALREQLQPEWFLHWRAGKVYGIPKVNVSQLTQSFGKPVELKCDEHLQLLARISHKPKKNRGQKLPKCLLHMNFSSFKHDPQ